MKKEIIPGISRRSFVKGSALAAGSIVLTPLSMQAVNKIGRNETLRVALVGCGGRGTGAAMQALKADPDVELVAMADAFRDRLDDCYENLSKIFGKDRLKVKEKSKFTGFDAYRKAIDMADVVILATTPAFRPYHFKYAIENDKHVFMEKPLATDAPGVRSILETGKLADEKKLNVVVGLQRHYETRYRKLYKKVREGQIGKITAGQLYWNGGGVWVRERQPDQTEMEYQMRNWYYFTWLCGDHIVEQHIHNIDVANWFLGEYPENAQGMGGREVRTGKDHGQIFDHHFVEFTYPSGAVIASQCRHIKGCWNMVSEVLQGTEGTVDLRKGGTITDLKGNVLYQHNDEEDPNPYQVEHDELFVSIRNGGHINNTEFGAKSTMSAILGRMATYSGQMVTWDEALNSGHHIVPDESKHDFNVNPPVVPDREGKYPVPVPGEFEIFET